MNSDFFDLLAESTRPLSMVFQAFVTSHELYRDVATLLAKYHVNAANKVEFLVKNGNGHLDVVDVYYDHPSDIESSNFMGFLAFNRNLDTVNGATYLWKYRTIIAVGRNRLSGAMMDIPAYMFPWTMFPFVATSNLFHEPIVSDAPPRHQLVRTCKTCQKTKKSCIRLDGMCCTACPPGKCEPVDGEENARAQLFHDSATSNAFAFSPPYQHLIQSVKAAQECSRSPKLNAVARKYLKLLVEEFHVGVVNPVTEQEVFRSCRSAQIVEFLNGRMRVVLEKNMGGVFGFDAYEKTRLKKVKVACCTPHLGLSSPQKAYSLVDAAISRPGEIFYLEECIMLRGGEFVSARIFMVGSAQSEDRMTFVVGWN